MELLDDPVFKTKYQKHKMRVKLWESDFMEQYGRKPNKTDIKAAAASIRESYKMYWNLKTRALEETLTDASHTDSKKEDSTITPGLSQLSVNYSVMISETQVDEKKVSEDILLTENNEMQNVRDAWGDHLTQEKSTKKTKTIVSKSGAFQLSQKMFQNANFAKRNPRKSLSMQTILSKSRFDDENESSPNKNILISQENVEQDVEPIFQEKIHISNMTNEVTVEPSGMLQLLQQSKQRRKLDFGWIERCGQWMKDDKDVSDEEDFICNSDSEEERRKKRIRNIKKRFDESEHPIMKRPCINTQTSTENKTDDDKQKLVERTIAKPMFGTPTEFSTEKAVEQYSTSEKVQQPQLIVDIVDANITPRLSLNVVNSGDLINDFSRILQKCTTEKLKNTSEYVVEKKSSKMDALQKKVTSGKANENFVSINLKKKVYVRGKRNFNYSRYKRSQWKQLKKSQSSSKPLLTTSKFNEKVEDSGCFKCGDKTHFARQCSAIKGDDLLPLEEIDDSSTFPTLEEAAQMARQSIQRIVNPRTVEDNNDLIDEWDVWDSDNTGKDVMVPSVFKVPEHLVEKLLPPRKDVVSPFYPVGHDLSVIDTPSEVFEALSKFGYKAFRPGQEVTIMRILSGLSTLVTLSTGSGKSLCYQLPAYLYAKRSPCITLVISPLVSLMDDQVTGIPHFLSAACIHTNQTETVRHKVIESVKSGRLDILLVSPEAIVSGNNSTAFGGLLQQLPPIAFACIDEAHCISQWSHNFRPSYLMLCNILKEKLGVKTVLGLTATATKTSINSIIKLLEVPDGKKGVITERPVPDNLQLSVSRDENRDHAIVCLLRSERLKSCDSIIVYCTRRDVCERVAALLRTALRDRQNHEEKANISSTAMVYHAGLTAARRKAVQKAFMKGATRIVVATVAFGMGINKSDIRAVIHYDMPSTFERYVQEIGRAGRDGFSAVCHLFLDPKEENDKCELRRYVYANSVDRHTIRKLLQKVFVPCSCCSTLQKKVGSRCAGHEVAIPVDKTVKELDITEETISTLLCYLELHPKNFIKVLSSAYVMACVCSYGSARALKIAAQSSPPLAMAIAQKMKDGSFRENDAKIEFPVIDIAAAIGWDSGVVKSHLKSLEWTTENGKTKRSLITVKFNTLGLRVHAPGDLSETELDEALEFLADRSLEQEMLSLAQLDAVCSTLHGCSTTTVLDCLTSDDKVLLSRSETLKEKIREYFIQDNPVSYTSTSQNAQYLENETQIVADVRALLHSYKDTNFTGRAVARIFHGIQSPNFPALVWSRNRFWRAHVHVDFNILCRIATHEILAMQ